MKRLALLLSGIWLALAAQAASPAASAPQAPLPELPKPVLSALQRQGLPADSLGLVIQPVEGAGKGLLQRADEPMAPASAMKLLIAAVALDRLGPGARGRTDVLAANPPSAGVIEGELFLRGGADTDLDWPALWWLLRELREQGVQEIRGGLVVDRSLFSPARLDLGVTPFDGAVEFPYNVIPDALNFNTSLLEIELNSEGPGIVARSVPALPGLRLDTSSMRLSERPCHQWEEDWIAPVVGADGVKLQGAFPRGCRQRVALNVVERQRLVTTAVRLLWQELGGTLGPGSREGATPAKAVVLASHTGRPLVEVLRDVVKASNNPLARLTYLSLGANANGEATLQAAERRVREWLLAHGINDAGLVLENGSGLSRTERISPQQLAAVLLTLRRSAWAPELLASLPLAGVDGTLRQRLQNGRSTGRARLKTGLLRDARALAGFVRDARDRDWVFVALLNHPDAAKGRPVLDALVEWVASQK